MEMLQILTDCYSKAGIFFTLAESVRYDSLNCTGVDAGDNQLTKCGKQPGFVMEITDPGLDNVKF